MRLPSISNRDGTTVTSGNASRKAGMCSQCSVARRSSSSPARARMYGPPEMPPRIVPLRASRLSQAKLVLSLNVAGLPPAQTNTISAGRSLRVPQSGMIATPFEAVTGSPEGAACHQRYSVCPESRFAARKGSMAAV